MTKAAPPAPQSSNTLFGYAEGGVVFKYEVCSLDCLLFGSHQQHHGPPQLIPHTRKG